MVAVNGKNKREPHDDAGERQPKEGKIGSGYMPTVKGQPELRDTVELKSQKDHELRIRELKE
ncbi:MAG: hypothetical protein GX750_04255 [Clostridia bacterium]|nr:hypothetical protein [Clostridia bacterium]